MHSTNGMILLQQKRGAGQAAVAGPQEVQHGPQEGHRVPGAARIVAAHSAGYRRFPLPVGGSSYRPITCNSRSFECFRGEGLSKTAIGDYLGEKSPFHEQVLKAFVDLHDFTDLILVQALRQFLWSFRLPGEAQKIDRMMETFAQRYCQLNPNIFSNTDTCYVLSFAVIMLNTSLHNPSVKEKSTLEQFITMNRGINDGKDLPRDILEVIRPQFRPEFRPEFVGSMN